MIKTIYLDHAAATPLDERVLAAMQPYFQEQFHNPSAVYLASRAVKQQMQDHRAEVAHWLGSRPGELLATAGATEANNIFIKGIMQQFPDAEVAISAIEHESVSSTARDYSHSIIPVDNHGVVTGEALARAVSDKTVLVSIIYANNEVGTIQHIGDLSKEIAKIRQVRRSANNPLPIYLHTDAVQAAQYLDLHVDRLGIDAMTISAAKIYGPKQVGALYVRSGIALPSFLSGGGQERGVRSGTENVAGLAAMATSLAIAQKMRKEEVRRLDVLSGQFIDGLLANEDIQLLGHPKQRLANNVAVMADGIDGERAVMMLDERGIQCSTGSACAALHDDEASAVVQAMGYSPGQASGSLRFSMGRSTTEQEVAIAIKHITDVVAQLQS